LNSKGAEEYFLPIQVLSRYIQKFDAITCNMSSQSSLPTKIISRGSLWRVPPLLTKNQDVKLIFCLASKSLAKLRHPLTAERGTGRGRRGASRPVSLSHAVLPPPSRPRRRCRRRCSYGRAPGPELRWAITLFHTRPAHSGNGKKRPPSAQAPEERARNPALSLRPAQAQRSLTAQAPNADNEKGLCGGSHPKASPAAYCAGVLQRPA